MAERDFIAYVGDAQIHDGRIMAIREGAGSLSVEVRTLDGETLILDFAGVSDVQSNRPIGMILYSLSELGTSEPGRLFAFINCDDEDDAFLEVRSLEVRVRRNDGGAQDAR